MAASSDARQHAVVRAGNIYGVLKQAAARRETCPTNTVLAERFSCGTTVIVNAIAFLEANGMITVDRGGHNRVVTIIATGERTLGRVTKPHRSRRAAA
jgi:DNA-binding FadR family transcriptional regulator